MVQLSSAEKESVDGVRVNGHCFKEIKLSIRRTFSGLLQLLRIWDYDYIIIISNVIEAPKFRISFNGSSSSSDKLRGFDFLLLFIR